MSAVPAARLVSTALGPCGRPIPNDGEALLFGAEVAHLLGLAARTIESDRVRGGLGLPFFRIGARAVRYRRSDIDQWLAARRRLSTADDTAAKC